MKTNGSVYVAVVLVALAGYFGYQWWLNPQRAVKRQLGELAAALSMPADAPGEAERIARAAGLRRYFAAAARVQTGTATTDLASRDAIVAAVAAWTPPPGGLNVEFVDVQIALDSSSVARAFMTAELTGRDTRTGELARDTREVQVAMSKGDGEWVITGVVIGPPRR
jgi:hypothetical protein